MVQAQSFPLVGEIGPHNYQKYVERGFNFVWAFISKSLCRTAHSANVLMRDYYVDPESEEHKTMLAEAVTPVASLPSSSSSM